MEQERTAYRLSIDPATKETGWALTSSDGKVQGCGLVRAKGFDAMVLACRVFFSGMEVEELVVEKPRNYGHGSKKVDPNDLIQVAMVGAVVIGAVKSERVYLPTVSDWKGQVPKDKMRKRLEKRMEGTGELEIISQALEADEVPPGVEHNVWDAIGLGMYVGGRLVQS